MQSNIIDLLYLEAILDDKVYTIAGELVNNINFDNYLKQFPTNKLPS